MSKFIDFVKLRLKAGDGGKGALTFRRDATTSTGGPSGGNGGNGANIYFISTHNLNTLLDLSFQKNIIAENGVDGQHKMMQGANGEDIYLKVPLGTIVYNAKTKKVIADLKEEGQTALSARGGAGGKGNWSFKSNSNKTAELHENGELGEEIEIVLELKLIADIGLVGLPNAGKSTLLSKLTYAKPKIADYPFTTLTPNLGVMKNISSKIVLADIPGLIEGASEGKGLGDEFLRHIERCRLIAHVIDISSLDIEQIKRDYNTIYFELKNYAEKLINKNFLLILTKTDLIENKKDIAPIEALFKKMKIKNIFISSAFEENVITELSQHIEKVYSSTEIIETEEEFLLSDEEEVIDFNKFNKVKHIDINFKDKKWIVQNEEIKKLIHKIPPSTYQNILRLNKLLGNYNLEKKLAEKGAKKGDIIDIYGYQLEMVDFDKKQ